MLTDSSSEFGDPLFIATDPEGNQIALTDYSWKHIIDRHEITQTEIKKTIEKPHKILHDKDYASRCNMYRLLAQHPSSDAPYMAISKVTVQKSLGTEYDIVITAYITPDLKGEIYPGGGEVLYDSGA